MKTIGLIGGMSWESTATYYRLINEGIRKERGGLASAELILNSLDFSKVVRLQTEDRWDEAGELLGAAGARLASGGADCILICTNTMHLVAGEVARMSGLPLIDIIDETAEAIRSAGCRRPLLLATRYTMKHGFYSERMLAQGVDTILPDPDERHALHRIIFEELCTGKILGGSASAINEMVMQGARRGADSVILGCTEIQLLLNADSLCLPGFDSTRLHADAAVRFALAA
jgi:aspartate racemase